MRSARVGVGALAAVRLPKSAPQLIDAFAAFVRPSPKLGTTFLCDTYGLEHGLKNCTYYIEGVRISGPTRGATAHKAKGR